jgi:hypothetical protein
MKFLVTGKGIDFGGPADPKAVAMTLENVINPSLAIIDGWIKSGKAHGGLLAGQRRGVLIMEAQSAEEIGGWLRSLPFWGVVEWEVIPLEDATAVINAQKKIVEMLRSPPGARA